ncbi:MAG TPA: Lpg1974 family pore-forming outer membrane protein [Rhabdochlamydiaceae bacterium]|jgi:hypothetical protein
MSGIRKALFLFFPVALIAQQAADPALYAPTPGARVFIIGDFLYWTAQQEGLDFSYTAKGTPGQLPLFDVKTLSCDPEWSTGFRVGLGYRLPHDLWEARGYVTQLRTTNHLESHASGSHFIAFNAGLPIAQTSGFSKEKGNWHLKYTLLDVELSRCYPATRFLAINPFLGARGAWIQQTVHFTLSDPNQLEVEGKNRFEGGGLRLGTDLQFYLAKCVSFFAQGSLSLLSGRFKVDAHVEGGEWPMFSERRKPHRLCANCELRAGAKGTIPLYRKQAFLTLGLSYDMALWFSQNQLLNFFQAANAIQVQSLQGNLTLQGITFSTRLDF